MKNDTNKQIFQKGTVTYSTNNKIEEDGMGRYISYTMLKDSQKEHKPSELYIDSLGNFGPFGYEITSSSNKHRIADNPDINYGDEQPKPAKWQKENTFKGIKHITFGFYEHGKEQKREFNTHKNVIKNNIDTINDDVFSKLNSFYFKSYSCYGAYHDSTSSVFEELQNKIKRCKDTNVKCFVSLLKKEYEMILGRSATLKKGTLTESIIRTPFKEGKKFDLDEIKKNKDKYFDYYYITKDHIYKIPHNLVKNRVDLIDNNKFEELAKKKLKLVDVKKEFKEFYDKQQTLLNDNNNNVNKQDKEPTTTQPLTTSTPQQNKKDNTNNRVNEQNKQESKTITNETKMNNYINKQDINYSKTNELTITIKPHKRRNTQRNIHNLYDHRHRKTILYFTKLLGLQNCNIYKKSSSTSL